MKAALVQPDSTLIIEEYPTPKPGRGEVLIKVAYCGICGTDIHMLAAGFFPAGCIIGHELSGHIAEAGDDVTDWKEGDPVAILPLDPCGTCAPCKAGETQLCAESIINGYGVGGNPGGFSQYMLAKPSMLYRLPDGMDMKTAALNEPWAVAIRAVNMSGLRIGEQALVMGAGPIGLLCIYALKTAGAGKICVSEPDPYRAEKARAAGADRIIDPKKENPNDIILQELGQAPDYVFDCAGTESSMNEAATIVRPHGRIIMLGVHQGNATIFPMIWFMKEISLNFSLAYNLKEFSNGLELLANKVVDPEVVISTVTSLSEIGKAFKALQCSGQTKILIDCQDV